MIIRNNIIIIIIDSMNSVLSSKIIIKTRDYIFEFFEDGTWLGVSTNIFLNGVHEYERVTNLCDPYIILYSAKNCIYFSFFQNVFAEIRNTVYTASK